jgi:hypothetical protein
MKPSTLSTWNTAWHVVHPELITFSYYNSGHPQNPTEGIILILCIPRYHDLQHGWMILGYDHELVSRSNTNRCLPTMLFRGNQFPKSPPRRSW